MSKYSFLKEQKTKVISSQEDYINKILEEIRKLELENERYKNDNSILKTELMKVSSELNEAKSKINNTDERFLVTDSDKPVFENVIVVDGDIENCLMDGKILRTIIGSIKLIDEKGNHKYFKTKIKRGCLKCKTAYLTKGMVDKIEKQTREFKLNVFIVDGYGKNSENQSGISETLKVDLQSETDESKHTQEQDFNLNDESPLRKLGYSTTLSREQRWNIIKNKAIPTLSKSKVEKHLRWLIKFNKGRKNRTNAVYEWEYDLRRLLNYRNS